MIAWFFRLAPLVRNMLIGVVVFSLVAIVVVVLSWRSESRRADTESAGRTLADARSSAAGDASDVRDGADTRTQQIDDTVKGATDEVRNAPDPAAGRRAARNGVCRLDPSACPR